MKIPHLTFTVLLTTALILTACDKELASDAVPDYDTSLELRCCDGSDIAENPLFSDVRDDLLIGLIEPTLDILEAMDEDYMEYALFKLTKCIDQGTDVEICAQDILELFQVKTFLDNINQPLWDSLRVQYPDLSDGEFSDLVVEGIIFLEDNDSHQLPCFAAYQTKVIKAQTDFIAALWSGNPFDVLKSLRDLILARGDFCACMYNTYNYDCYN